MQMVKKSPTKSIEKSKITNLPNLFIEAIKSNIFLYFIFVWFVVQALVICFKTRYGIPPDERVHFPFIKLFADNGFSPIVKKGNIDPAVADQTQSPFFLYHYLMSFPYRIFGENSYTFRFIRILNIALACGSLYLIVSISRILKIDPLARNVTLFVLTNTLMFTFLSASINYDNLFIFLCMASILLMLKLLDSFEPKLYLLFLIVEISGLMVKVNFLPICAATCLVVLVKNWQSPWLLVTNLFVGNWSKWRWALLGLLIVISLPFIHRYAGNQLTYGTYDPKCTQLISKSECLKISLFKRNDELAKIKNPVIDYKGLDYIYEWTRLMANRIYGILAHGNMAPMRFAVPVAILTFFVGIIGFIRLVDKKDLRYILIISISAFYLASLILFNHKKYLDTGMVGLAVQGRYSFAVLPLLMLISFHYTFKLLSQNLIRTLYIGFICLMFTYSCLPTFLKRVQQPYWQKRPATPSIKNI